jgi:hypothetical protein
MKPDVEIYDTTLRDGPTEASSRSSGSTAFGRNSTMTTSSANLSIFPPDLRSN